MARDVLAKRIGALIADARKRAGKKSEDLAVEIGASRSAVSMWENGRGLPNTLQLARLAKSLPDFSVDETLLGQDDAWRRWMERFSEDSEQAGGGVFVASPLTTRAEIQSPDMESRLRSLESQLGKIDKDLRRIEESLNAQRAPQSKKPGSPAS